MRTVSDLVLKYIGGLAIGAAVVGGYAGLRHVMHDAPTVLPSREESAKEPIEAPPESRYVPVEPLVYVERAAAYAEQPEAPTEVRDLPTACRDYFRTLERYAECEAVPVAGRESLRQAIDATRESFRSLKDPSGESREAMANACMQAADAILESGKTMGCQM